MQFYATAAMEKLASMSPAPSVAHQWQHARYGAMPGAIGGAVLGGLAGAMGDGESHVLRDAAIGATLGGAATGGRALYKAQQGGASRFARVPALASLPKITAPGAPRADAAAPEFQTRVQALTDRVLNRSR